MNVRTPSHVPHGDLFEIRANVFGEKYFDIDRAGTVRMRDLVTQERLQANQVPPAIAADPALGIGLNYLKDRGGRRGMTVHLMLASHGKEQDFTEILEQYPGEISGPHLMGIEANWTPPQNSTTPLPHESTLQLAPQSTGRGAFQCAQVHWLRTHAKTILPCEIENAVNPLPRALENIWNIFQSANTDTTFPPAIRIPTCNLALHLYQATRQWAILGQLGFWLARLDDARELPSRHLTVPLMLGSWHERSVDRLNTLNVPVKAYTALKSPKDLRAYREYGRTWMNNLLTMRAEAEFIRTPRPSQL